MKKLLLCVAPLAALGSGCASITQGTQQYVSFLLQPQNAYCTVSRDEGELGTVNAHQRGLVITKDKDPLVIECRAPGYFDKVMRVHSSSDGRGVLSFWFLDLGLTDLATGAMWLYPSPVTVTMIPIDTPQPAQPASAGSPLPNAQATQSQRAGSWSHELERTTTGRACNPAGIASISQAGAGVDLYSMACRDGSVLAWRCTSAGCQVLK
jgi:hypothetical protein